MLSNLALPSRTFVYLAVLSLVIYVVQSGMSMGMGMGMMRTIISKLIVIAIWAYVINMVARSGGASFAVAWALGLIPFMPVGLQFMF
jgi:hypothetical protein